MTAASEKFCLNWNDFQKNIRLSFQEMRDDLDLADVTLACEDRTQFQAHKFVLSASSPFFKELLQNNKHTHPLIYLKGIKAESLKYVLDFLYRGEVNIYQEDLDDFLALAEELELKGLTGQQQNEEEIVQSYHEEENLKLKLKPKPREILWPKTKSDVLNDDNVFHDQNFAGSLETYNISSTDIVPVGQAITTNNDELNKTIDSFLEKIGDIWSCKMCGQKSGKKMNLKRHIESMHTTGGSHQCKICGKIFRSSNAINTHMYVKHPK